MNITSKTQELEAQQTTLKKGSGDFTQVTRTVKDGLDYEVHEYGNPVHGYWGYQIIFREIRVDGEYIMSEGYGGEAKSRTFNWFKIPINI